jgi:hypothetical protein
MISFYPQLRILAGGYLGSGACGGSVCWFGMGSFPLSLLGIFSPYFLFFSLKGRSVLCFFFSLLGAHANATNDDKPGGRRSVYPNLHLHNPTHAANIRPMDKFGFAFYLLVYGLRRDLSITVSSHSILMCLTYT